MDNALTAPAPQTPPATGLLVADTDETQTYVFESSRLPEIRGASRQLDELNRQAGRLVAQAGGGSVIYAGGGSLLARCDPADAPEMVAAIEAMYPGATTVATISAAFRPLPADYRQHPFGDYVRWAGHWLRRHKESKGAPPFVETLSHQTVCQSCQKRPANAGHFKLYAAPLCNVCHAKYLAGGRRRDQGRSWHEQFETWLNRQGDAAYFGSYSRQDVDIPQTIDELANTGRGREGYVGFLYLDGDRIGDLLGQMPTEDGYRKLSRELSAAAHDAVFGALAAELRPSEVVGSDFRHQLGLSAAPGVKILIHPFEIITIGGDDVLLIVPAHAALPIARRIGVAFRERLMPVVRGVLPELEKPVTMSAGVVIADDHTPVHLMFDLARQLLKEAKKQRDALDFHVLKSADMVDRAVDALRQQFPYYLAHAGDRTKDLRLLARPYGYEEAARLWAGLKELRRQNFPSSQMALLSRALLQGRNESTLFYHYQHRREKGEGYSVLEDVLKALQTSDSRDPLPWQAVEGEKYSHETVLWDIAELYDFAPRD